MSRSKSNEHTAVSLSYTEVRARITDNVLTENGGKLYYVDPWLIQNSKTPPSTLPYAGSQTQLTNTIDSNFVGVLVHGECLKLYRTANTVTKSASLIINCFLSELDLWTERQQGRMPDIIYLQVDGGSENANKYMLGMLELLCVKRISKSTIYSRLPSFHSHNDHNVTFGVVKLSLKSFPMMTWDSFAERIKDCFDQGSSKLKVLAPRMCLLFMTTLRG